MYTTTDGSRLVSKQGFDCPILVLVVKMEVIAFLKLFIEIRSALRCMGLVMQPHSPIVTPSSSWSNRLMNVTPPQFTLVCTSNTHTHTHTSWSWSHYDAYAGHMKGYAHMWPLTSGVIEPNSPKHGIKGKWTLQGTTRIHRRIQEFTANVTVFWMFYF